MYTVETLNFLLGLSTLLLQAAAALLLLAYFSPALVPRAGGIKKFLEEWGMMLAFALSFASAALTLYYSDVLGFEPCPLCWWQRIFLYPQIILFALALWYPRYRSAAVDFSIAFSVFGAGIALYHHALQMLPSGSLPCPATGASCAQRLIFEFGYITYPLMAFSLFVFLIAIMLFLRQGRD
jgi:disulfide bond formation protein DsbB